MSDLQELTDELMQDTEFRKEYEAIQPEMDITRAVFDAEIHADISRPETGSQMDSCGKRLYCNFAPVSIKYTS